MQSSFPAEVSFFFFLLVRLFECPPLPRPAAPCFSLCCCNFSSAQVCEGPQREGCSQTPPSCSLSWGRHDRKSARWHGAGLQHVTSSSSSSRRGGWSDGGVKERRGGDVRKMAELMESQALRLNYNHSGI